MSHCAPPPTFPQNHTPTTLHILMRMSLESLSQSPLALCCLSALVALWCYGHERLLLFVPGGGFSCFGDAMPKLRSQRDSDSLSTYRNKSIPSLLSQFLSPAWSLVTRTLGRSLDTAVFTNPMHLVTMENNSKPVSTTSSRRVQLSALSGVADSARMAEVLETDIIPVVFKAFVGPGRSDELMVAFDRCLEASLSSSLPTDVIGGAMVASPCRLSEFVGRHLFSAVVGSFFGPTYALSVVSYADFCEMTSNIGLLIPSSEWSIPRVLNGSRRRSACAARGRTMNRMGSFLEEWWYADGYDHIKGISPVIERVLRVAKDEELTLEETAGILVVFLSDAFVNVWTMTFSLMSHAVFSGGLIQEARELHGAAGYSTSPLLDSAVQETLRWTPAPLPTRHVDEDADVDIDGKRHVFRAGTRIVLDMYGLHHDEDIFPDPERFDPIRFLDESLPLPRPFGEGRHMCKGIHLAILQIKSFVSHALKSFDFQVAGTAQGSTLPTGVLPFSRSSLSGAVGTGRLPSTGEQNGLSECSVHVIPGYPDI